MLFSLFYLKIREKLDIAKGFVMASSLIQLQTEKEWEENPKENFEQALSQYRSYLQSGSISDGEEADLYSKFDRSILEAAHQTYDSLSPAQQEQYSKLASIWHDNIGDNNQMHIENRDDKLILRNKNTRTGLELAIMNDQISLVLAQDKQLTTPQVENLKSFMENAEMKVSLLPSDVTVLTEEGTTIPLENAWNEDRSNSAVARQAPQEQADEQGDVIGANDNDIELPQNWEDMELGDLETLSVWLQSQAAKNPTMNPRIKDMRNKVRFHMEKMAGITRVSSTPAWNGCEIIAYKEDSKGKEKKSCSLVLSKENGKPCVTYKMWNGEKFEVDHAVMILDTLKAGGAEYFELPPVTEIKGASYGAFWKAAGKRLMVPLPKSAENPKGPVLDASAVQTMLKEAEEAKSDSASFAAFKEKLLGVLQEQEAYQLQEAQKKGKPYTTNSELGNLMVKLSGSPIEKFNLEYLSNLAKNIGNRANDKNGWDFIEAQAGLRAAADLADFIRTRTKEKTLKYNNSPEQNKVLDRMFQFKMEEHKKKITKELTNEDLAARRKDKDPLKEIREDTQRVIEKAADAMEEDFPGIKLALRKSHTYTPMECELTKTTKNRITTYQYVNKPTEIPYDFDPNHPSRLSPLPSRTSSTAGRAMSAQSRER